VSRRLLWSLAALVLVCFAARSAAAAPDRKACIAAADDGQKLRDEAKLASAREKFITCADKACPGAVSKQCATWVEEVDREMPTLSFRAKDETGREILDAQVLVDDKPFEGAIQSKAAPIDPGSHKVRVIRKDGKSLEDTILVRASEKDRIVELAFPAAHVEKAPPVVAVAPPPKPQAPTAGFHVPWYAWIGVGVGAVGGVGTVAFALSAKSDEDGYRSTCAPACNEGDKSGVQTKVVLANVSMGVGIAGLGFAVGSTIFANLGGAKEKAAASLRPAPSVAITPGGGVLLVRGGF
jgi:hypothetical protein